MAVSFLCSYYFKAKEKDALVNNQEQNESTSTNPKNSK
jgi:hypothetical protein